MFAFFVASDISLAQNDEPIIKKVGKEYILVLPESMRTSIAKYDSTFAHWKQSDYLPYILSFYPFSKRQAPFAVIGDFNGDGTMDVVLQGHDNRRDLTICILSTDTGFKPILITRADGLTNPKEKSYGMGNGNEYGLSAYLTYASPGKLDSPFEEKHLNLKTDAFQIVYFEKSSVVYYFKHNSFHKYVTGD